MRQGSAYRYALSKSYGFARAAGPFVYRYASHKVRRGGRAATPRYRYALGEVRGFARVTIPSTYRLVLDRVHPASTRSYRYFLDWMRGVIRVTIPLIYGYLLDRGRWCVRVLPPLVYPYFTVIVTALAALVPLFLVLYQSLLTAPLFESGPRLGFSAYRFVLGDDDFAGAFRTTLLLAAAIMLIAVPLGTTLAFLIVRTDVPGRLGNRVRRFAESQAVGTAAVL
jgi:hypothetical protein